MAMTMTLIIGIIKAVDIDTVVSVQVEEKALELGDLTVGCLVDLREAVDGSDAGFDG